MASIVLIVISLVVLGGVILYFALTGKKGGSSRGKNIKSTASKQVSDAKEEVVVEKVEEKEDVKEVVEAAEVEETKEEVTSEDKPKTGDVE